MTPPCYTRKLGVFCLSPPNRLIRVFCPSFEYYVSNIYVIEQMNLQAEGLSNEKKSEISVHRLFALLHCI